MCGTILIAPSLYLEQEVRIDEQEGQQLAAGTGVVARPGFVGRAGDRRLFTGAASLVRIFLLPPTKGYSLGSEQS
jgi:PDZ domain-containing secreted protein